MFTHVNQVLFGLLVVIGFHRGSGLDTPDWESQVEMEQSWETQKLLHLDGDLELEDQSNNDFAVLREQPVKEIRLKRAISSGSGSGDVRFGCTEKVDIGFILQSSTSIGQTNFDKIKSFVKELVNCFKISQDHARVSILSYASTSTIHFPFSRAFTSSQELNSTIDSISYNGGGTNIGEALATAYSSMFKVNNGARLSEAKKVLIVLTDGQNGVSVDQPAQELKNIGVIIYSIGVGSSVGESELRAMASSPVDDHVYLLESYDNHSVIVREMTDAICYASSYLVICARDFITVVIGRHETTSLDIDNMYLADGICKASYNDTHVYVETPLNGCGTQYSETDQVMFYNNTLTAAFPTSPGSVITRKQSFAFTFKCTYSRLLSVGGIKFEPPKTKIEVENSDLGNFTVNFESFKDSGFLSSSSEEYPAFKSFQDRINIQYGVTTSNTDIVVRAETCRATPSSKPYDIPQYEFISEGCDKDSTITHITSGLQQNHRFTIQVFRFVANHTFVYIHCDIRLCNKKIPDSICTRSTTCSNRKRRDVSPFDQTHQLSIGPIMYQEQINQENDNSPDPVVENTSSPSTIMIVILVCAVLIVVLLVVVVVFMVRKRRARNDTTSVDAIPMEYPADKMLGFGNGYMAQK